MHVRFPLGPLAALLVLAALPAAASDKCNVPKESWRPVEELTAELTAKGWTVKTVKTDDGCYEVYGTDDKGKRVEAFIDPASFEIVGYDD